MQIKDSGPAAHARVSSAAELTAAPKDSVPWARTGLPAWTAEWRDQPRPGLFSPANGVQAKLDISQPGDPYEQEADRVAEQVMRMPDTSVSALPRQGG